MQEGNVHVRRQPVLRFIYLRAIDAYRQRVRQRFAAQVLTEDRADQSLEFLIIQAPFLSSLERMQISDRIHRVISPMMAKSKTPFKRRVTQVPAVILLHPSLQIRSDIG